MKRGWPRWSARIVQVGHGTWAVTVGGRKVSRKPLTGRQALWACVRIFLGYPIGWSLERARKVGPSAVQTAVARPVDRAPQTPEKILEARPVDYVGTPASHFDPEAGTP